MLLRLDQSARMLEGLAGSAKKIVTKKISKNPPSKLKESINNFLEFFVIEPISLDPYGIMKKLEHIVGLEEKRFKYFAKGVAPDLNSEEQANLAMGFSGAISLNQIAKIVRHFVELVRKMKSVEQGMMIQMQLPLIERISKALLKGTEALTNGWPIGDAAGALVGAHLIGDSRTKEIEEDTLLAKKKLKGRNVFIIKAKGPGGRLGKLGRAVEKLTRRQKIAKIITVDAAGKLEGEKTGNIAEGIGVAIGGVGVDRAYIENIATRDEIPLDTIVVKMSQEEAIMPMRKEILNSIPKVIDKVKDNIAETKQKGNIIVVGVGNCCGIGNDEKAAKQAEEQIRKIIRIVSKKEEEEKKKEGGFFKKFNLGI